MRNSWGSWIFAFGFAGMATAACAAGCSSSDARPPAEETNFGDGGNIPPTLVSDGGKDGGKAIADTCSNTIKDGHETDVDCGGDSCPPCIDGKVCVATDGSDCVGKVCANKVCVTRDCNNGVRDGDETDVDCGGATCKRCTIGKRCAAASDCASASCGQSSCTCPKGMVTAPKAGGDGAYCVDEVEVTKFQYNKFVTANVSVNDQIDACKPPTNTRFNPPMAWPPSTTPGIPNNPTAMLAFNLSLPVHYVDWCDAYAYCKWANKELCGSVNGGAVEYASYKDATKDSWYNACSAQGTNTYPYGAPFDAARCNGGQGVPYSGDDVAGPRDIDPRKGYGAASNADDGLNYVVKGALDGTYSEIPFAACAGGVLGLYQMSGNAAEWENSCDGDSSTANCRVRGGSYAAGTANSSALACDADRSVQRVPSDSSLLKDIGFRCCLY